MNKKNGKILTFYSFKGGVGRTMALANVAFIASMSGKKVLMMDWDLEAPGLEYYFRGLTDRTIDGILRDTPGILNLLDEWSAGITSLKTEKELRDFKSPYDSGDRFQHFTKSVIDKDIFPTLIPSAARIDIINAGSKLIGDANKSYEQVLSTFSWTSFFSESLGGYLLERLCSWARKEYDIILIDSRTGLADVAGICTLAIPDTVALCLVLNQQNIDGIGKVAAAITSQANDSVTTRVVPMRVSRRDSSEGSDAQARVISTLSRVGGIQASHVQEDMAMLQIAAEDNVPFYETLAPFFAIDPSLDPLTLSYARLARELFGSGISAPDITQDTLRLIKSRILPKNATVQYVIELKSAEPLRARSEISRLIDVAAETGVDTSIDNDYVIALCETVLHVVGNFDGEVDDLPLLDKTMDILRYLANKDNPEWNPRYINFIRSALEIMWIFNNEEVEIKIRLEFERLLEEDTSNNGKLCQLDNLQEIVRLYRSSKNISTLDPFILKMGNLITLLLSKQDLSDSETKSLAISVAKYSLFRGEIYLSTGEFSQAENSFTTGLRNIENLDDGELDQLDHIKFRLLVSLSKIPSISTDDSAKYCVEAARLQTSNFHFSAPAMFAIILRPTVKPEYVIEFARATLSELSRRRKIIAYFIRTEEYLISFVDLISKALKNLRRNGQANDDISPLLSALLELLNTINRSRNHISPEVLEGIISRSDRIITETGVNNEISRKLVGMLENIRILSRADR